MRVGLFGGSFNPPHVAHLMIAETIREQFALDRILWIPAYQPPHKAAAVLASPEHRLNMTRLATADNPYFTVSALEIERQGTSFTFDTICALQADAPDTSFYFLLGGDSLHGFPSWHRPYDILARVPLIVYHRPGASPTLPDGLPHERIHFAEAPLIELSSKDIRQRVYAGQSIRYRVVDAVQAYIHEHRLYSVMLR